MPAFQLELINHRGPVIPEGEFGRDHWGVLLHMESIAVDEGGRMYNQRKLGFARLRLSESRHWNLVRGASGLGRQPRGDAYPTRLAHGGEVSGHDDADCICDLVDAGYIELRMPSLETLCNDGVFEARYGWQPNTAGVFSGLLELDLHEYRWQQARVSLTDKGFAQAMQLRKKRVRRWEPEVADGRD